MATMEQTTPTFTPIRPERYKPAPWQLEDLEYLSTRKWSANWSEMGCYKTTTGLWLLEHQMQELKKERGIENPSVLIITTRSGKGTYYDAIPKVLPDYDVYDVQARKIEEVIFGQFREKVDPAKLVHKILTGEVKRPHIFLAHYHCFMNKAEFLQVLGVVPWAFILVDEVHRMKERTTQWTKNIKRLKTIDGRKHVMTGTGFINRPDELWSPLNFLNSRTFNSYMAFFKTFCEVTNIGGFDKVTGVRHDRKEEFRALRRTLGPRRMMKDVHSDIAEPIFSPVEVELNPTQRKMYNEIKRDLRTLDLNGVPIHSPNVLSMLNRLRQICVATPEKVRDYYDEKLDRRVQEIILKEPSSKLDALMEILEGMQWDDEDKQQVVVFSCFEGPLALLEKRLNIAEIPFLWMKASHGDNERYKMWHDTWPSKQHRVFMATLQLGSESINLSSAEHAVFLDRSWSPKDNNQGVSRIYRPGQTGIANIIHINATDTTDQRIERTNITKVGWFNEVFGDTDD